MKQRIFYILSLILGAKGTLALALSDTTLIVPIGGVKTVDDPTAYFKILFQYAIGLAALLALAMLVYGAVQYTASAGFPSLQENAKGRMRSAIFGLILLIASITILTTLGSKGDSGNLDLSITPLPSTAQPTDTDITGPSNTIVPVSQVKKAYEEHQAILDTKPDYKKMEDAIIADATDPSLTSEQRRQNLKFWELATHRGMPEIGYGGATVVSNLLTKTMPANYFNADGTYNGNYKLEALAWQTAVEKMASSAPKSWSAVANYDSKSSYNLHYNWIGANPGDKTTLLKEEQHLLP